MAKARAHDPASMAELIANGDRRSLARGITLVESTRAEDRASAAILLDALLASSGGAHRIGVSGPPGVGKSTFIETLGLLLCDQGRRVAVLAVDPSSRRSGGSILGDKTRMDELAKRPGAFIRPSPSGGALGGVTRRTRDTIVLCEAGGFDVVLVETVGVGQSETEVDEMVDTFVLLAAAGSGDELQGMKRGITEFADVVLVTKADGDLLHAAERVAADYRHALHLLRAKHDAWIPEIRLVSAATGEGVPEAWDAISRHRAALGESAALAERRAAQLRAWLWSEVREQLLRRIESGKAGLGGIGDLEAAVVAGRLSPPSAAARALEHL